MARKKNVFKYIINLAIVCIIYLLYMFLAPEEAKLSNVNTKLHEKDYVNMYCKGTIEYILPDKTRIDCLDNEYAYEYDWASKWYEGIGQALWYAENTGKKPALALIIKTNDDYKYVNRAKILCEKYGIKLVEIKAQKSE